MFYSTTVKSVSSTGVIDKNGKFLSFVGYKSVKPGDFIWTDGNVVFGHTPIRGESLIFSESGIPVLADKGSDDKELRGYFDLRGNFKKYKIAGEHWIVNDKKLFKHDDDEATIIDAEISDDGKLYTVEKKISAYTDKTDDDYVYRASVYNNTIYCLSKDSIKTDTSTISKVFADISFDNADYARHDNIFKDCQLIIKKGTEEFASLNLSRLCKPLEDEVQSKVNFIDVEIATHEDHIKSRAVLQNFKILSNGKWEALLECSVWAERGFSYESHLRSKLAIIRKNETETITPLGEHWRTYELSRKIIIVQMPEGRPTEIYTSSSAHCYCLIKINSDGVQEFIWENFSVYPLYLRKTFIECVEAETFNPHNTDEQDYPYIYQGTGFISWAVEDYVSYDEDGNAVVPAIPAATWSADFTGSDLSTAYYVSYYTYIYNWHTGFEQDWHEEHTSFAWLQLTTNYIYNSRNLPNAPDYDSPIDELSETFTFPVQDNFHAKLQQYNIGRCGIEGIYDADDKRVCRGLFSPYNYHKCNLSFIELKGGDCLLGVHDDRDRDIVGSLYKISKDGDIEQVGEGLKNFRLRELKNIGKAKR